ncbi:MAG: peptidoglycan-binding protein [Candidatus Omnitrophica bacterium]|nr:peptidoglycan-binding protein [Candidatus Omnitrophota bacterium]
MKKIITYYLTLQLICAGFIYPTHCYARSGSLRLVARSAFLYDLQSGKVIYSKNINVKRAPASLTKIVTAMVVLDHLDLQRKVRVSRKASHVQPTKVYLTRGEYYTAQDLLYAVLLNSGNDAAVCLAEAVAGSEGEFATIMNKKVRSFGAYNTRFINASGLPGEGQYSTAYDLALVMKEAMRYPFIRKAMREKIYTIHRPNGRKIRLRNHNKLLWRYSKRVVGKTGYTRAAGRCFLGMATHGKKQMIICVLNSKTMWSDVRRLLDYGLGRDNYQIIKINRKLHDNHKIKKIQSALKRARCDPGSIDGIFGIKTLEAVIQFQRLYGLSVDGIIGQQTFSKLHQFM